MRTKEHPPTAWRTDPSTTEKRDSVSTLIVACKPVWDSSRRELLLDGVLVKRFRQPAKNQAAILAAFHEEGWPQRIDDPLTGGDNVDGLDRLHDAIRRLNEQTVPLIRFLSDGLGKGIMWELRKKQAPKKRPRSAQ